MSLFKSLYRCMRPAASRLQNHALGTKPFLEPFRFIQKRLTHIAKESNFYYEVTAEQEPPKRFSGSYVSSDQYLPELARSSSLLKDVKSDGLSCHFRLLETYNQPRHLIPSCHLDTSESTAVLDSKYDFLLHWYRSKMDEFDDLVRDNVYSRNLEDWFAFIYHPFVDAFLRPALGLVEYVSQRNFSFPYGESLVDSIYIQGNEGFLFLPFELVGPCHWKDLLRNILKTSFIILHCHGKKLLKELDSFDMCDDLSEWDSSFPISVTHCLSGLFDFDRERHCAAVFFRPPILFEDKVSYMEKFYHRFCNHFERREGDWYNDILSRCLSEIEQQNTLFLNAHWTLKDFRNMVHHPPKNTTTPFDNTDDVLSHKESLGCPVLAIAYKALVCATKYDPDAKRCLKPDEIGELLLTMGIINVEEEEGVVAEATLRIKKLEDAIWKSYVDAIEEGIPGASVFLYLSYHEWVLEVISDLFDNVLEGDRSTWVNQLLQLAKAEKQRIHTYSLRTPAEGSGGKYWLLIRRN